MCFSATASFTVGTVLIVVGAITARRVRRPSELPLALIPALFGIQQLIEGALWLTFSSQQASSLLSSHPAVRWFGVATAISLILAAAIYTAWFILVWCFFAATISVFVLVHFVQRPSTQDASTRAATGVDTQGRATWL